MQVNGQQPLGFEEIAQALWPKLHRYCARMAGSAIDGEDACALASKAQYRRSTVADAFTGALPSANDDRNLAFKTHSDAPSDI